MSDYLTNINRLRIVEISHVTEESPTVRTFTFDDDNCSKAEAGQFIMVWIPGVDEIPMSLSMISPNGISSITVAQVGQATKALHQCKPGDLLGVRGPFGNGFKLVNGSVMIVGGGTGLAPLMPLAENLASVVHKITFLLGAKTKDELLFLDRIGQLVSKIDGKIVATTEDGSYGLKGVITKPAEEILAKEKFDMMYTCGQEQMMYRLFLLAKQHNTPMQASLERIIRCGIGLCGSCTIGEFRVCKEGPVLDYEQLRKAKEEFGKWKRDFSGRKTSI